MKTIAIGSQDGVNRSEWYSYNPMSSVTTLATSGSDGSSTLGGMDQSCADFVLMASPIRGEAASHLNFLLKLFWFTCSLVGARSQLVCILSRSSAYPCHMHSLIFIPVHSMTALPVCAKSEAVRHACVAKGMFLL